MSQPEMSAQPMPRGKPTSGIETVALVRMLTSLSRTTPLRSTVPPPVAKSVSALPVNTSVALKRFGCATIGATANSAVNRTLNIYKHKAEKNRTARVGESSYTNKNALLIFFFFCMIFFS
jgi:hypothetical protein